MRSITNLKTASIGVQLIASSSSGKGLQEPNPTVLKAINSTYKGSRVLLVGLSHSRELLNLSKAGYTVAGVDSSKRSCIIASEKMREDGRPCHRLVHSAFENQTYHKIAKFDAIISHRVLPSVSSNKTVKKWVQMAERLLLSNGKIFIGNPSNLWTREDYLKYFSPHFKNFIFEEYSEPESFNHKIRRNILVMSATKKH